MRAARHDREARDGSHAKWRRRGVRGRTHARRQLEDERARVQSPPRSPRSLRAKRGICKGICILILETKRVPRFTSFLAATCGIFTKSDSPNESQLDLLSVAEAGF